MKNEEDVERKSNTQALLREKQKREMKERASEQKKCTTPSHTHAHTHAHKQSTARGNTNYSTHTHTHPKNPFCCFVPMRDRSSPPFVIVHGTASPPLTDAPATSKTPLMLFVRQVVCLCESCIPSSAVGHQRIIAEREREREREGLLGMFVVLCVCTVCVCSLKKP